jgi:hypothetical protein
MLLRQRQAVVHCNGRSGFMKLNIFLSVWAIVCLSEWTLLLDLVKVKLFHSVPWERRMERSYSSYSFMTSELDGCEESTYRPGRALPRGKGPSVPIVQFAMWVSELVCSQRVGEKSLCLCWGFAPLLPGRPVVVIPCTAWASPAHP